MFRLLTIILALGNAIVLPSTAALCVFMTPRFRVTEHTLSYMGSCRHLKHLYRPGLLVMALSVTMTFLLLLENFALGDEKVLTILALIAGVSLAISSLTPSKFRRVVWIRSTHNATAALFFISTATFIILFQAKMAVENPLFGNIGLVLGLAMLVGTAYGFLEYKMTSIPELIFLFLLCAWFGFIGIVMMLV